MDMNSNINCLFNGYRKTPLLWGDSLLGLSQFEIDGSKELIFDKVIGKRLRLGHLIEHFVQCEFVNHSDINVIANNVQVYSDRRTIGEFDLLIEKENIQYQIEIVFKFYLYDENVGATEIEHWIGPNRKDSLVEKITKIKEKQFPLVEHPEATKVLDTLGLDSKTIRQRVFFKGKLFVPYWKDVEMKSINPNCIVGFYIEFEQLDTFKEYEMYIPSKHDWLVESHEDVTWLDFKTASVEISKAIAEKRSPLVWFKGKDRKIEEGFVVWW